MDKSDKNIVGWWNCEEATGTTVLDELKTNDMTLNAATWVAGGSKTHGKYALSLDGNSGTTGTTTLNFPFPEFTITFWIKRTATWANSANQYLGDTFSSTTGKYQVEVRNNRVRLRGDGAGSDIAETSSLTQDVWQHVALVSYPWNGTNHRMEAYVDGTLVGLDTTTSQKTDTTTAFVIGRAAAAFVPYDIDDIRIFSRPLKQAEVRAVMHGFGYAK